ncbi:MAG: nucleotide exchange factor GrpE [Caldicoprobacterales bacterium]|nr:nucleotide exchange factor GrpE [Clostridiales bacterium]
MNDKMEMKESVVNEEYQEQEPQEGCCSENEQFHPCCCEKEKEEEESAHQCDCKENSELENLKEQLAEAEAKQDEYLKAAQRLQADFENYKRRNRNALAESYETATADVVEAFLPVLDNLDRAIESISEAGADDSILKGIEMVRRQFLDTLAKLNVEEIEAMGKPFDPELHNAVGQVEAEDGQEENTVALVLQKGYRMGERVIRYSMVQVAR